MPWNFIQLLLLSIFYFPSYASVHKHATVINRFFIVTESNLFTAKKLTLITVFHLRNTQIETQYFTVADVYVHSYVTRFITEIILYIFQKEWKALSDLFDAMPRFTSQILAQFDDYRRVHFYVLYILTRFVSKVKRVILFVSVVKRLSLQVILTSIQSRIHAASKLKYKYLP